ncbi:MAG: cysteine desulfurase NifS [Bacilli bacterium]|nr:cysteine desulfurase NifS [Bacilli bacterium]
MLELTHYFDHAATTPMFREVLSAMEPYFLSQFGNPGSLHQFGFQAREALEAARNEIAAAIGANSKDLVFTGSATEADNIAILGAARRSRRLGKGAHVITTSTEHPAVLQACQALEKEGFELTYLPVDACGLIELEELRRAIRPETVLISIMHGNNVVGTLQPIREIGQIARESGVLFHCDAVQSFGKLPIDVDTQRIDLLTINAHKIGGPKGVAALYVRKGVRLDPLVYGGSQERALRPATPNVAGIVGFAKAVELTLADQESESLRLNLLRTKLIERLQTTIPGFKLNGHPTLHLPNLLNISIDRIEGQALMLELDRLGFATSSGSACSSTDSKPSYVLLAMGTSRERALESLRITMGRTTTARGVEELTAALEQVVAGWRGAVSVRF